MSYPPLTLAPFTPVGAGFVLGVIFTVGFTEGLALRWPRARGRTCSRCKGTGHVKFAKANRVCFACGGKGSQVTIPDFHTISDALFLADRGSTYIIHSALDRIRVEEDGTCRIWCSHTPSAEVISPASAAGTVSGLVVERARE